MFTIELDMTQFAEEIEQTLRIWDAHIVESVKLAEYFHNVIRQRTPVKTGQTRDSWTIHIHKAGDLLLWEISPDGRENEVTWLEFGTKPHVILPKNENGVLVFEKEGETVFTRHVFHPGTKPLGIVRVTQDEVDKSMEELVQRMHDKIRAIWS